MRDMIFMGLKLMPSFQEFHILGDMILLLDLKRPGLILVSR